MSYTKLFQSIITSTIWTEDSNTCKVWVTMLALANKHGEVQASIPGLAQVSGLSLDVVETAINKFLSPDKYSRTPDDEGRRIEKVDGGWVLLNHAKYREMASREEEVAANAKRQAAFRERQTRNGKVTDSNGIVTDSNALSQNVTKTSHIAEADTDTEADTENKKKKSCPQADADDLLETIWKLSPPTAKSRSSKKQLIDALKAIPATSRPSVDAFTESLRKWIQTPDWTKDDGAFIPGIHLWVKNRKWEFEPAISKSTKNRFAGTQEEIEIP